MSRTAAVIVLLVYAVLLPLGAIWALNVLFHTGIPFTFKTWFAVLVLLGALKAKPQSERTRY